jgi:hypothetical protein
MKQGILSGKKMTKYILGAVIALWHLTLIQMTAFAVNPNDIIRLKEVGVSNEVIREIINSDAISRALISMEEIIGIKKAHIGDEIILEIIRQGNVSGNELNREERKDRALKRKIRRLELRLDIQKEEMDILREYLVKLITDSDLIRLVNEGKIAGDDYAEIVKYLKHYARDEDTVDYSDSGDISVGINKTQR